MKIAKFSRLGFILAASGSAVGLGNIWKFPYITGEYGGGAFVFIYLITISLIGVTILLAEMLIGYMGKADCVTSFENLAPKNKGVWKYGGFMAFSGLMILTFYSVVIGWIFNYIFKSFSLPNSISESESQFNTFLSTDITTQLAFHTIVFLIVISIVVRGIKGGIEKLNLYLMPTLALILIGIFFYALSLDGFSQSFDFMFNLNWDKLSSQAIIIAVGHAFFTISLGMGAIMTYSASLPKNVNLFKSSLIVVVVDTAIALLAGLTLFAFLFEFGSEPAKGPGLVFISLPAIFNELGGLGNILALLFFISLAFAGLTSAVSLLEPSVQYFIDRFKLNRVKATLLAGSTFYIIGIFTLLANTESFSKALTFGSKNFFDWMDFTTSAFLLPLGGIVMAIFVGFIMQKDRVKSILEPQMGRNSFNIWYFVLKYIAPLAVLFVMLNELGVISLTE